MKAILRRAKQWLLSEEGGERAALAPSPEAAEQLPRANRIVVYGTNIGGVYRIREELSTFLEAQGVPETDVVPIRYIENIEPSFFGQTADRPKAPASRPQGVIMLSQMRTMGISGGNMTINTPVDAIVDLCVQHEVPYVLMEHGASPEQSVGNLAMQLAQRPETAN